MIFTLLARLFSVLMDLLSLLTRSDCEKELEIALLRQQIHILQRTRVRPPRLSWWEKLPLTLLAMKLIQGTTNARTRLSQSLLLFTPETVLQWHRDLVRRKWCTGYFMYRPQIPGSNVLTTPVFRPDEGSSQHRHSLASSAWYAPGGHAYSSPVRNRGKRLWPSLDVVA